MNKMLRKLVTFINCLAQSFTDCRRQKNFGDCVAALTVLVEQEIHEVAVAVEQVNDSFAIKMKLLTPQVHHKIVFWDQTKTGVYWLKQSSKGWMVMGITARTRYTSYLTQSPLHSEVQKALLVETDAIVVDLRVRLDKLVALRKALSEFQ